MLVMNLLRLVIYAVEPVEVAMIYLSIFIGIFQSLPLVYHGHNAHVSVPNAGGLVSKYGRNFGNFRVWADQSLHSDGQWLHQPVSHRSRRGPASPMWSWVPPPPILGHIPVSNGWGWSGQRNMENAFEMAMETRCGAGLKDNLVEGKLNTATGKNIHCYELLNIITHVASLICFV